MKLPEFATKYKVTTTMLFIGIIIIGLISLTKLSVSLLPDIEFPKITVITSYQNASPMEIRNLVTRPLEEGLSSVSGVKKVESKSIEGISIITLTFSWGNDMDMAMLNVSESADQVRTFLPQDVEKPIIIKFDPASMPVYTFSVLTKTISYNYLKRFIKKEVKTKLERIKGVGSVNIIGGRKRIINVEADLQSLFSYNTSLNDIMNAVSASNFDYPAGNIEKGDKEYLVRTVGRFKGIGEIENAVVKTDEKGTPVYLKQIAKVEDTLHEKESVALIDGDETIAIEIKKEAGANTVDVCRNIKETLQEISEKYEGRIKIEEIQDSSQFITSAISNVYSSGLLGGLLAFLVLLFFLKDMKSAVIVVVSMPISIIATFIFMYMSGLSINMMSLGGLALGIGMLVDNSIVVLENINRLKNEGMETTKACIEGTVSVQTSIFGSTLTSIIVFLPLIFVKGLIGALFKEMAFTISFSLLSSVLIAIFLLPMLSNVEWKKKSFSLNDKKSYFVRKMNGFSDHVYNKMENRFINIFQQFFNKRKLYIVLCFVIFVISIFLFSGLNSELMPKVKENYLNLWVKMKEGTTIEATQELAQMLSKKIKENNYVEKVFATIGYEEDNIVAKIDDKVGRNMANFTIFLDETISPEKAFTFLEKQLKFDEPEKIILSQPSDIVTRIMAKEDKPILIHIEGKNVENIKETAQTVVDELQKIPGVKNIDSSLSEGKPEIKVEIDRDKMATFGLNIDSVSGLLKIALGGTKVSKYHEGDNSIDIRVRLRKEDREDVKSLRRIYIPSPNQIQVPLIKFAKLENSVGLDKIIRDNQADIIQLKADYDYSVYSSYGKVQEPIENKIQEIMKQNKNTDVYQIDLKGENERYQESFSQLIFMFLFSIIFIYMIIASLFESLGSPLILMLSVPLGLIGVAPSLFLSGLTLNIMSGMGLIMLGGITINSAVVLLEFINQKLENHSMLKNAIFDAVRVRFKPIIMSVFTTILGLLPLAIGIGKGTGMQQPLAVSVIGGLVVSTFLTLLLIPTLYYLYQNMIIGWRSRRGIK